MKKSLIGAVAVIILGGGGVAYKVHQDHTEAEARARAEAQAAQDQKNIQDNIKRLNRREDTSFTVDWSKKAK